MNKKLIAAAVSAAVMAPVASQADATVYGRISNAIDLNNVSVKKDPDDGTLPEGTTDISGVSSRFGIKGSADIGNGLTAKGTYEFGTVTDREEKNEEHGGVEDIRVATVGLSGSFGSIDIGNQWSAYFDTFGTLISPTYTLGYYLYSSVGGGPYRTSNTIKYSNTFGPVYLELDYRLNGSDEPSEVAEKIRGDGFGLGVSFAVAKNITIAASMDSEGGVDGIKAVEAVDAQNAIVTPAFNPGNKALRGPVIVDVLPATNIVAEKTFVAVTTVDTGGGDIALADITSTTGIDQAGEVLVPAVAAVDAVPGGDDPNTDRLGVAIKAKFGGYWVSVGFQNQVVGENKRTGAAEQGHYHHLPLWRRQLG